MKIKHIIDEVGDVTEKDFIELDRMGGEKLWDYLVKKLEPLNDNNKTAKDIFNYITRK